jgi:predicted dehydrogenase
MEQPSEKRLRHVVIGIGGAVFTEHVPALALPTVEVVAVSDINVEKGKQRVSRFASKSLDIGKRKGQSLRNLPELP